MNLLMLFLILCFGIQQAVAQESPHKPIVLEMVIVGNDTLPMVVMDPLNVVERRSEIIVPDKLKLYIRTVYPYALRTARIVEQIDAELAAMKTNKQRKEYLKSTEKLLRKSFEEDLRNLTRNQGKILTKLIYRETGSTVHSLIGEYRNNFVAGWWQMMGKIFDQNLKMQYNPAGNEEDRIIEQYVQYLDEVYQRSGFKQDLQKQKIETIIPKTKKEIKQEKKEEKKAKKQ
jgi:hypothetical protein